MAGVHLSLVLSGAAKTGTPTPLPVLHSPRLPQHVLAGSLLLPPHSGDLPAVLHQPQLGSSGPRHPRLYWGTAWLQSHHQGIIYRVLTKVKLHLKLSSITIFH